MFNYNLNGLFLEVDGKVYKYHHTSWHRGYVRKAESGYIEPYKGHFGKGYTMHRHSSASSAYYLISYYVEK